MVQRVEHTNDAVVETVKVEKVEKALNASLYESCYSEFDSGFHKTDSTRSISTSEDDYNGDDLRRTVTESVCRVSDQESLIQLQRKKTVQFAELEQESSKRILHSLSKSLKSQTREEGPRISLKSTNELKLDRLPRCAISGCTDQELKFTQVAYNPTVYQLYEDALKQEAELTSIVKDGALATLSGAKTGRSPKDKRIVWEEESFRDIWWCGDNREDGNNKTSPASPNIAMDERSFALNRETAIDYLKSLHHVYVVDGYAGWDPEHRIRIRCICAKPYHALFIRNMIVRPTKEEMKDFAEVDFTIINAGQFPCNRFISYMSSDTSIDVNFKKREMVILGTMYAGEMKKGIFTIMNYLMPKKGVLSLHSGCNKGESGVTLFFGLSGTGKTTLSTEAGRALIGDDEHCWDDKGVFNIEGGCYAKCIGLNEEREPEIFQAIRFGTVLENVTFDSETRVVDFDDGSITENTRAAYPIEHIQGAAIPCLGSHPTNIILLCCDAFGVLPPVSRLTISQALYYFISGYTAKVAGTEQGVVEPEATFSACFGSAFLVWHPLKYCSLLAEKMSKHITNAWLLNTGWTSGPYGSKSGHRIKLKHTRAIVNAIHGGDLLTAKYTEMPEFGLHVPIECPNVPQKILQPRNTWDVKEEYDEKLAYLGSLFNKNFEKVCLGTSNLSPEMLSLMDEIKRSGPN